MIEEFKKVKGYEYEVSNLARVRTIERKVSTGRNGWRIVKSKILKPYINKNGYLYIGLHKKAKLKNFRLHRLVYKTFKELKPGEVVMHDDNNKLNCRLDNLRAGSNQENTNQAIKDGLFITHKKRKASKTYKLQTLSIRLLKKVGFTLNFISSLYGYSTSYISLITNKKRRVWVK